MNCEWLKKRDSKKKFKSSELHQVESNSLSDETPFSVNLSIIINRFVKTYAIPCVRNSWNHVNVKMSFLRFDWWIFLTVCEIYSNFPKQALGFQISSVISCLIWTQIKKTEKVWKWFTIYTQFCLRLIINNSMFSKTVWKQNKITSSQMFFNYVNYVKLTFLLPLLHIGCHVNGSLGWNQQL